MATNLQIKFIKSLQLKKNRYEHKQYVCEGVKIVEELVQNNTVNINCIYATETWKKPNSLKNIPVDICSQKDLEKMSGLSTPPEVLALVDFYSKLEVEINPKINLFLDQISDPGNLGTIIRTADWYGLKTIFISRNCVDVYSPKVIQAAMGSHFRVRVVEIDFNELINHYTFESIYATAMTGISLNEISVDKSTLIIMGSESHGVSQEIFDLCSNRLTIPSFGTTESLNVSVATGIILHQLVCKIKT